jgi:aminopeptidase N
VWALVLAYSTRLIPPLRPVWRPWAIPILVLVAAAVSFASYRTSRHEEVKRRFDKHYVAGLSLKAQGNFEEAEVELEKAQAIQPGDPDVKEQLRQLKEKKTADHREETKEARVEGRSGPPGNPPESSSPPAKTPPSAQNHPGEKPKPLPHRVSPFEITHYGMDLDLYPAEHKLKAKAVIQVRSRGENVPVLQFSLNPQFKPQLVQVDGAPAKWDHRDDLLEVTAPHPLEPGKTTEVTVRYNRSGPAILGNTLDLISERACFLRSETRWYPATGELDFRSPVTMKVSVPEGYTAVSVGALKSKAKSGDRVTYLWDSDRPASMVSVAAADYDKQVLAAPLPPGAQSPGRGPLEITCYTFPEHHQQGTLFMKEAASIVRFYEQRFGPYPYEKLAVVEIPLFPGGYGTTSFIMLVDQSFAARKVDREFISHEIAHQWWGNSVFPQGMGAAWLSEAFANYSAFMYDAAAAGNPRVLQKRIDQARRRFYSETAERGDQAIAENDVYQPVGARDAIIYEKGAVILHMLRREVGDAIFFKILRAFADRYHFGRADINDFRKLVNEQSGKDLGWFFDQWLGRKGGMDFSYSFKTDGTSPGQYHTTLTITQPDPPYRARMKAVMDTGGKPEAQWIEIQGKEQQISLTTRGKPATMLFDPAGDYLMKPPRWDVQP